MTTCKLLTLLALSAQNVFSANILYVSPMASPSHHIWNRVLALGLVSKGHNVTYISPDADSKKVANYTQILLEGIYEAIDKDFDMNALANASPLQMIYEFKRFAFLYCTTYEKSQGLRTILNYPENFKFDVVVFDNTGGGCLYPLIQRFNYPPTVAVTGLMLPPYISNTMGNHLHPAYVPWYSLPYSTNMTFIERVWNFIYTYTDTILRHPMQQKDVDAIMRRIFGEGTATIEEIENHISLLLANTDPILNFVQPMTPNIIPVGGLHARQPAKLPKDIQRLLDEAKHGVIVFSLGTNVRSDKLGRKTQDAILEAFSKRPETVIWKFESEIENLPKNVIVRKWLPQNDVLGHANVKLFIGHGGALSTQESMYHGVPMVSVPFFLDQHINTINLVNKKLGVYVDIKQITAGYFLGKLNEVLDNPDYGQNMRLVSKLFRDRQETPLERAIFWIEYVMRHGGAHFLSSPARHLPFYVASSLDVLAFLTLITVLVMLVVWKIFRLILNLLTHKKKIKIN